MSELKEVFIEDELTTSYLSYAMSVIVGRALPDVRDGLKPVHRRILFVMRELNNTFDKNYKKSARIVGDVIGKYHPHGEIAVYDSIVRLAQSFVQRYVLIDGQGNFGSIDGDSPAAMRYTEIKMSEFSDFLLKDLDSSVVDFIDNYDSTEKQPVVLPTMIPNLLVNGSYGIAVGMATNIPPHNLIEIIDACILLLDNFSISVDELMKVVLAPDFPTCGIIYGTENISSIYKTGRGKFFLRANACIYNHESGCNQIIVDELPYQVNKAKLIESIVNLVNSEELDGIKSVRDESDKDGLRICIEILKGKNPDVVLNNLFLHTKMQVAYNVNMVALVDNIPRLLNLKSILKYFLDHRKEIVYRRTQYKLSKADHKAHLLEGFCVVILNLEQLIKIIVSSNDFFDIKLAFSNIIWNIDGFSNFLEEEYLLKFKNASYIFSDIQLQSILDMRLSRLTKLEKSNLFFEYSNILKEISNYRNILSDNAVLDSIVKNELLFVKEKFGDFRKTKIVCDVKNIHMTDLVLKENLIITLSDHGYIKSQLLKNYSTQRRGGRGKNSLVIKPDDFISVFLVCDTHSILLCFSTFGKVYWIDLHTFPLSLRKSRGIPILNLLDLNSSEKINFILPIKSYNKDEYVLMITKKAVIKKILLTELKNQRSNGLIVIELLNNDILVDVKLVKSSDSIMLFSKLGRAIRFFAKDIRCASRSSRGVLGMKLSESDCIVSLVVLDDDCYILTVTENGYGKQTKVNEFSMTKRGGRGIMCMRIDKRNGFLVNVEKVFLNNDLLLITSSGIISRIKTSDISCTSRNTKGVCLINLSKNEKLVSIKAVNEEFL